MVTPNAQWVEVAIALSVALAAFNNLVPFVPETRWSLAFSLGLMHGFGFVSAIRDLGASGPSLGLSVFGFNLGVEVGQLGIVALFVPAAWLLRERAASTGAWCCRWARRRSSGWRCSGPASGCSELRALALIRPTDRPA